MHGVENQLLFRYADAVRQLPAHGEWRLAAGPDFRGAGIVRLHHAGVGFQIRLMRYLGRECIFNDHIGLIEPLLDDSLPPLEVSKNITDALDRNR